MSLRRVLSSGIYQHVIWRMLTGLHGITSHDELFIAFTVRISYPTRYHNTVSLYTTTRQVYKAKRWHMNRSDTLQGQYVSMDLRHGPHKDTRYAVGFTTVQYSKTWKLHSNRDKWNSPYNCNTVRKCWKDVVPKLFEWGKLIHAHIRICKNQSLHYVVLLLGNAQSL